MQNTPPPLPLRYQLFLSRPLAPTVKSAAGELGSGPRFEVGVDKLAKGKGSYLRTYWEHLLAQPIRRPSEVRPSAAAFRGLGLSALTGGQRVGIEVAIWVLLLTLHVGWALSPRLGGGSRHCFKDVAGTKGRLRTRNL